VVAFSTESLCERYLRDQAAERPREADDGRMADRRRTLRGWHLPPTHNRCIPTDSQILSLAELHVEGAPLEPARPTAIARRAERDRARGRRFVLRRTPS
jgi:hypothetical protein